MIVLGIESAADLAGVALGDQEGPRASVWVRGGRRHTESLAPAIAHVLEQTGLSLADVDVVAVDVGPGLFTGLRVGVATAQGLAQGLGVAVLGITSVAVLARAAYAAGWSGPVLSVVDARRGEVFAARYDQRTLESAPPARYPPAALASLAAEGGAVLAVGNGAIRYRATLGGARVSGIADPPPDALVALAADQLAAGQAPAPPAEVRPVYLREPDARINWAQR